MNTTLPRSKQQRTSVLCSVMGERYRVMANERAYLIYRSFAITCQGFLFGFMPILWDSFWYNKDSIQLNKDKQWTHSKQKSKKP